MDLLIVIETTVGIVLFRCQIRLGFCIDDGRATVESTDDVTKGITHLLCVA